MRNLPALLFLLTAIAVAFGATAVGGGVPAAEAGVCGDGAAVLSFSDDAAYSGPGPFNAFVLVMNTGTAPATDVVLAFEVVEGGEFFHEAVFGNEQLWWAHGAPDAGVIYFVPEVPAGGDAGVRFVATMRPEWAGAASSGDARTVIRVSVAGAQCAEAIADGSSGDEVLLTFSASADGSVAEPTATAPIVTATRTAVGPVRTATPAAVGTGAAVSTVLGVEEAPTGAARPTSTAPSGEILPEGGEGGGDSASSAALVLAGVAIALVFLAVGVGVGRVLPR